MSNLSNPLRLLRYTFLPLATLAMVLSFALVTVGVAQGTAQDACPLPALTLPLFDATPPAKVVAGSTPVASSGSTQTEADVLPSIEIIVACANTEDPSLVYAVFTPRYLASQFTDESGHYLPELEQRLAMGVPLQAGDLRLVGTRGFSVLDDGRVEITVITENATGTFADTLILARTGEYWLVDDVVILDPAQSGNHAGPSRS